jgi:ubiquinone/menaquinone biosynthesis C-methylase UbiE
VLFHLDLGALSSKLLSDIEDELHVSTSQAELIRAEYMRREKSIPKDWYSLSRPSNLFAYQQRQRDLLKLLSDEHLTPLEGKTIVDIGCGSGQQLLDLVSWGARLEDLAGIDLIDTRVARACMRLGNRVGEDNRGPDLRIGDASKLPWGDGVFDIAHQNTVFTSILDSETKHHVAAEIVRVLKPNGVLLWYDFLVDNPRNPHVKGIGAHELRSLFPECVVRLKKITLAPPISRRLAPASWIAALVLEKLTIFNTHYLAVIRKSDRVAPRH